MFFGPKYKNTSTHFFQTNQNFSHHKTLTQPHKSNGFNCSHPDFFHQSYHFISSISLIPAIRPLVNQIHFWLYHPDPQAKEKMNQVLPIKVEERILWIKVLWLWVPQSRYITGNDYGQDKTKLYVHIFPGNVWNI